MADFDLAVRGGTVVQSSGRANLDVYVKDGKISLLAPPTDEQSADEVVDATGLFVMPGMVDTHIHLMDPGDTSREDFPTGTAAAAIAGVTTIVEHTHASPVRTADELAVKREHLNGRSHIDYGLAAHAWPDSLAEIPKLWRAGVVFFKAFTCATHGIPALTADQMSRFMRILAQSDGAALVHCEDDLLTADAERELRAAGRSDPMLLVSWRTREAEELALLSVAHQATRARARVTLAHVSNAKALDVVDAYMHNGLVVAESCPQYLFLKEAELAEQGPLRKFTPPARIRSQYEEARMWDAFNSGRVHHISSDHAPSTRQQKQADIWSAPFGLPGVDTTMSLLLDSALTGRTSLERVVEVYSEAPARHYRLTSKGGLAVGKDADIILVDPEGERQIADERIVSKAQWSPYAGRSVRGRVRETMLRGRVVARDGTTVGGRSGELLLGPGASS